MWEYSDKVKEYFFAPKNAGPLTDATAVGEVGAMSCGDALRLMLKIDPASEMITDARFQTFGCGSAIASSSALTELIIGKTLAEAMTITNQDIADFLGGLPPEKMHCSVMGYEALRAAVANYRGETWEDDHDEGALICKCFGIDEGIIDRAIRMNRLTSVEQVAHYTKVTGSCGTCAERVEEVLERVNRAMVAEGALAEGEAFNPAASPRVLARVKAPASGKRTTLQRLRLIEQTIEELRPTLMRDGGDCELVDIEDDLVSVKLTGACTGCQLAGVTIEGIQQRLIEKLGQPLRVVPVRTGH
jgi:NifU-like protein